MQVHLTVTEGPHQGRVFVFQEHDNFIVGRSKRAQFRLPLKDRKLSRVHFMVEVNPPRCRLMDLCSTNGTVVNGKKVQAADLSDGDTIRAGETTLRLSVVRQPEPLAATAEYRPSIVVKQRADGIDPGTGLEPPPLPKPASESTSPYQQAYRPASRPLLPATSAPGGAAPCIGCGAGVQLPGGLLPLEDSALLCPRCRAQAAMQPQPIPGYQCVREIGRGGMGVVHLAIREADGLAVALKMISPVMSATQAQLDRFLREAHILRKLDHPNVVGFRDMGEIDGSLFFAMDYVAGSDAARILEREGPLPIPRAVGLLGQLLEALEYAHDQGFVHRDIKPGNLLVGKRGDREIVKLADFGLARVYQTSELSGLTMTGDLGGTLAFMAPEQITHYREAKPPADQYSAAATLYNLLTNQIPFEGGSKPQRLISKILEEPPVPIRSRRPDVPRGLADTIHRALAKEPEDRFPDVNAFRQAIASFRG